MGSKVYDDDEPGPADGVVETGVLDEEFWRSRWGMAETFLSMSGMKTVLRPAASAASMAAISASRSLMTIRFGVSSMAMIEDAVDELRVCPFWRGDGSGGDRGSSRAAGGSWRRRYEVANAVGPLVDRAVGVGVRGGPRVGDGNSDGDGCLGKVGSGGSGGRAGRTSVLAMCGLYFEVGLVGVSTFGRRW